jgi:hypothetical protein
MVALFSIFLCAFASTEIPRLINYQGKLTDPQGIPLDTTVDVAFSLFLDSTSMQSLWTEEHEAVVISEGLFNAILGSVIPIPDSAFDVPDCFLGITIDGETILPLTRIVSVGYAYKALNADTADYAYASTAAADSDWVIDGDNIYRENGNVGIGTTSPEQRLGVDGLLGLYPTYFGPPSRRGLYLFHNLYLDGGKAVMLAFNYPEGEGDDIVIMGKAIYLSTFPPGSSGQDYARLVVAQDGNVGIGTASPGAALEVRKDLDGGQLHIGRADTPDKYLSIYNGGAFPIIDAINPGYNTLQIAKNGVAQITVDETGNVGIGSSNPTTKLEVAGTVQMWGFLMPTSATNGHVLTSDANGNGTWQPAGNLGGSGTINYIPKFTAATTLGNTGIYETDGKVNIGTGSPNETRLNVSGTSPQITIRDYGTGVNQKIGVDGNGLSLHYDGGASLTVNRSNGKVGIGTMNPSTRLDVSGAVTATTYHGDGSNLTGISGTTDNDWTINGSTIYHLTGNVGIGKSNPSRNLDISGDGAFLESDSNEVLRVENTNTAGGNAIYAVNHSADIYAAAISGKGASTTGDNYGVLGVTMYDSEGDLGSSAGVYGKAASATNGGDAFGVLGECWTRGGYGAAPNVAAGVYGICYTTSGASYGVWGETESSDTWVSGVYGINTATSGETRGVTGAVNSTASGASGVLGYAPDSANPSNVRGVTGYCHSSNGYGVLSDGNSGTINGTKSSIVTATRGQVKLYCQESPEVWFEDFGEGQLINGQIHVELDPLFLETVTVNDEHPMKVFVQLNDNCSGVFVKRGKTGFDVIELYNGKSSAQFSYRVVAKRKGFEGQRLEEANVVSTNIDPPQGRTSHTNK